MDTPASPRERLLLRSAARDSLGRIGGEVAATAFMTVNGVLTARALGASNKGVLAALTFLVVLVSHLSMLGLGDAAVLLVGRQKAQLDESLRATLAVGLLSGSIGAVLLIGLAYVEFQSRWTAVLTAALVASAGVPGWTLSVLLQGATNVRARIHATSAAYALTWAVTALLTVALFVSDSLDLTTAAVALVAGPFATVVALLAVLRHENASLMPRWSSSYLRQAIRVGFPIQASYLFSVAASRVDLLIVYPLAGAAAAGRYSVALTLGQLVVRAPFAISMATFPRLSVLDRDEFPKFASRLSGTTLLVALSVAAALAVTAPVLTPLLFGSDFRGSVGPGIVLVVDGVFASLQRLFCRFAAVRERGRLIAVSYGLSLTVMIIGDLLLIPSFGVMGAAAASLIGSVAGLAVLVGRPELRGGAPLREFLPRRSDVRALFALLRGKGLGVEARAPATEREVFGSAAAQPLSEEAQGGAGPPIP
jgi:O-antigen/teichoic acid export membrane protein